MKTNVYVGENQTVFEIVIINKERVFAVYILTSSDWKQVYIGGNQSGVDYELTESLAQERN